jgi:hypothetical protein
MLSCAAGLNATYARTLEIFQIRPRLQHCVPTLNINLIKYVKTLFLRIITGSHQNKQAPGSFIFSLRNKENFPPFKAPLKNQNYVWAIYAKNSYGPTFGGGHDIHISNDAGSNTGSFTYFYSYQAPSGVSHANTILAGTQNFQPSEIEVFHIV